MSLAALLLSWGRKNNVYGILIMCKSISRAVCRSHHVCCLLHELNSFHFSGCGSPNETASEESSVTQLQRKKFKRTFTTLRRARCALNVVFFFSNKQVEIHEASSSSGTFHRAVTASVAETAVEATGSPVGILKMKKTAFTKNANIVRHEDSRARPTTQNRMALKVSNASFRFFLPSSENHPPDPPRPPPPPGGGLSNCASGSPFPLKAASNARFAASRSSFLARQSTERGFQR